LSWQNRLRQVRRSRWRADGYVADMNEATAFKDLESLTDYTIRVVGSGSKSSVLSSL
jgi:hypothetical protein